MAVIVLSVLGVMTAVGVELAVVGACNGGACKHGKNRCCQRDGQSTGTVFVGVCGRSAKFFTMNQNAGIVITPVGKKMRPSVKVPLRI